MAVDIMQRFAERMVSSLRRTSVTSRSSWAQEYRMMDKPFPGLFSFKHHPWLREMHDADNEQCVGQKAAQMGYTETMLNIVFYEIDINGADCLYALPTTKPDATDFSAARFDPALELSPHLTDLFTDVKNVGHKRANSANLYVRGSRARNALKSIPAGIIILDEVEEFVQRNIPLAFERASGQLDKQIWLLSTPSIERYGINKYFLDSTQDHFHFKCPHCDRFIELTFPDSLHIEGENETDPAIRGTYVKCNKCHHKLEHLDKPTFLADGKWQQSKTSEIRGFYINQLYSATAKPYEIAALYFKSLRDPADEQEFYNSKLGLPHATKGARISDTEIEECKSSYTIVKHCDRPVLTTMGVDVGTWLHVTIDSWTVGAGNDVNAASRPRTLSVCKVQHFEELDELMRKFQINFCTIDANPERRKALEFARRFYGYVTCCLYSRGISGKTVRRSEDDEHIISVDRTAWLDLALGRFHTGKIIIPADVGLEYTEHLKTPVKIYEKDASGNPIARYVKGGAADHYAHARTYSEIAFLQAASMGGSQDIPSPI